MPSTGELIIMGAICAMLVVPAVGVVGYLVWQAKKKNRSSPSRES